MLWFTNVDDNYAVAELLPETEQEEKKSSSKSETATEEFLEKALLPSNEMLFPGICSANRFNSEDSLQHVYLDTITPPPNQAVA